MEIILVYKKFLFSNKYFLFLTWLCLNNGQELIRVITVDTVGMEAFFPLVDGSSFVFIVEELRVIRTVIFVLNVAFYS